MDAWFEYYTYGELSLVLSYLKEEDKMQYLESQKQKVIEWMLVLLKKYFIIVQEIIIW